MAGTKGQLTSDPRPVPVMEPSGFSPSTWFPSEPSCINATNPLLHILPCAGVCLSLDRADDQLLQ
jgi:hypothetical protein